MIDILVSILIALVVLAVIFYIINNFLPIDPPLRQLILLVIGVIFVLWLLLTLTGHVGGLRIGGPYR